MTRECADFSVYHFAKLQGYKFDEEHYFEFRGVWERDNGVTSYVYKYVEPPRLVGGHAVPTGHPIYWECSDIHTGWIGEDWMKFEAYMQSTKQ